MHSYVARLGGEVGLDELDGSFHSMLIPGRDGYREERSHVAVGILDGFFHPFVVLAIIGQRTAEMRSPENTSL